MAILHDKETGLYYLQSRYYNPEVGRWTGPEPNVYSGGFDCGAGLAGYNVYIYCANNPVMYKDTFGSSITLACIIIGAAIGATIGGFVGDHLASKKGLTPDDGWDYFQYVVAGGIIGGVAGGMAGYAIAGTQAAASVSWTVYKSTHMIWPASYYIGHAFEEWFYKTYNVALQQVIHNGRRLDAVVNGMIFELKNYHWSNYTSLKSTISSFISQANHYLSFVGDTINGQVVKNVTFLFSSRPPDEVIRALEKLGVIVRWL